MIDSNPIHALFKRVREKLGCIQRGEGAYRRDLLEHANNVIGESQQHATDILRDLDELEKAYEEQARQVKRLGQSAMRWEGSR